jgi:3-(methylthio)propanoyl-CoA dehydrogenase
MEYQAPLDELSFLLQELVCLTDAVADPEMINNELATTIFEEAGKFATGILSPLNRSADLQGLRFENGSVQTPDGFREAYQQFIANGWNNVVIPEGIGGQGLPYLIASAVTEIFSAANKSFTMCPGLTLGAIEALAAAGSDELKSRYLPKMVSGEWAGTMNLTEPQAGSDVGAIRSRAVPQGDGSYRIFGQKIFISFGEHDLTENIIHLVLARLPDAPDGVRGISLFLVPKFLVNPDGSLGARNDVQCAAIEHKTGIHASPTCVLVYGESGGAVGYRVGEVNKGLAAMFVMMNMARLSVGIEGVAIAERACQLALEYARGRIQGTLAESPTAVAIIEHADVRRMLMLMKSQTEAMRAMAWVIAEAQDLMTHHADPLVRASKRRFIELMIPVFKAWATETGVEVASLGIQIHGGMGYVEETGAAQLWRDARISPIYEGTTGIQANDLIGRKLFRDAGESFMSLLLEMKSTLYEVAQEAGDNTRLITMARSLEAAVDCLQRSGLRMIEVCGSRMDAAQFVSVPFLMLFGRTAGGWLMVRVAIRAHQVCGSGRYAETFLQAKQETALFYCRYVLAETAGLYQQVMNYLDDEAAEPTAVAVLS